MDPACYAQKQTALVGPRLKEVEAAGEKPVKVSESFVYYGHKPQPGVLYRCDYSDAKAGERPAAVMAVVVEGKRAGTKLYVRTDKKCRTHALHWTPLSSEQKAERKKQTRALRVQQAYRNRLLEEIYWHVPNPLAQHELDRVALNYFQQLGHDSQHRIFIFFGSEEAKTKSVSGVYVDYPKLAGTKLGRMTTGEIGKFLVACALVGDLYCPAYASGATLSKDPKLAKAAAHYRVNTKSTLSEVTEKLRRNSSKRKTDSEPRPPRKPKQ